LIVSPRILMTSRPFLVYSYDLKIKPQVPLLVVPFRQFL
jgi:hypothetical protein